MLALLSPSKTLDFSTQKRVTSHTAPELLEHSSILMQKLRRMSANQISKLMGISASLAEQNRERYQLWHTPFTPANSKQASLAFKGNVYEGLCADKFSAKDFQFAQKHLRILSGLYGVLRPLDLIQPYRLEMGTKLPTRRGKDLYAFWNHLLADTLNKVLDDQKGDKVIVNLASVEYFKAIDSKQLNGRIVVPSFKESKGSELKMISFFAKKARGTMAAYAIKNRITDVNDLRSFDEDGYRINKKLSTEDKWLFTRK